MTRTSAAEAAPELSDTQSTAVIRPYADHADDAAERGFDSLPIPAGAKSPPPAGYTGAAGASPTVEQMASWKLTRGADNMALRLPRLVVGIDVDHGYGDKRGAATLAALEAELGPLPPTHRITSRGAESPSGIYLYRLPAPVTLADTFGPAIDAIQFHHRYAMAPGSMHPDGRVYECLDAYGEPDALPYADELAELPAGWCEHFTVTTRPAQAAADDDKVTTFGAEHNEWSYGEAFGRRWLDRMVAGLDKANRHGSTQRALCSAAREAGAGVYPFDVAVAVILSWFRAEAGDKRAGWEFDAMVAWAVGNVHDDDVTAIRDRIDAPRLDGTGESGEATGAGKPSQATKLANHARERFDVIHGDDGTIYLLPLEGRNIVAAISPGVSEEARRHLIRTWRKAGEKGAPSTDAIKQAADDLAADAIDLEPVTVLLRVAPYGDGFVYDRGTPDGSAVIVEPGSVRTVARSPVPFRRSALTAPAPEPVAPGTGDPWRLAKLLNVAPKYRDLLVAWLVAALLPGVAAPGLKIEGPEGSTKTTATRTLGQAFDPSSAPTQSAPADIEALILAAQGRLMLALDNLSGISAEMSDALCRLITGDAIVKRALYTNGELAIIRAQRTFIVNGITLGLIRPDLADRLLPVELERPAEYLTDAEVSARFAEAWPAILGGLFDACAAVLAIGGQAPRDIRMAGFGHALARFDAAHGTETLDAYRECLADAHGEALESDRFAQCVIRHMHGYTGDEWEGSVTDLLRLLVPYRDALCPTPREWDRWWPSSPQAGGNALKRSATALRRAGYHAVLLPRLKAGRKWRIRRSDGEEGEGYEGEPW